jgi:hypothetical protein
VPGVPDRVDDRARGAVARHLPAAQSAGDDIGMLDDIRVIEQVEGGKH